jgi:hypothetical protein
VKAFSSPQLSEMSSNSKQALEAMTVKQLRSLLRQRELPVPGRKSVLVGRLKNNEGQNIDTADYKSLNVKQLQSLLRQRGLPLSGRKRELVDRLQHGGRGRSTKTGPKPKAWQHREAKKDLKRSLLNPSSPIHNMTLEDIRNSDERFGQYPNFAKYYGDLKKQVEEEKRRVHQDDIAAAKFMKSNPRSFLNQRGYQHWNTHAAKALLEVDVANNLHLEMKPNQLRGTKKAYKDFPPEVFAKWVCREVSKQKTAQFWAYKRNKRGMKMYLREIAERVVN